MMVVNKQENNYPVVVLVVVIYVDSDGQQHYGQQQTPQTAPSSTRRRRYYRRDQPEDDVFSWSKDKKLMPQKHCKIMRKKKEGKYHKVVSGEMQSDDGQWWFVKWLLGCWQWWCLYGVVVKIHLSFSYFCLGYSFLTPQFQLQDHGVMDDSM